MADPFIPIRNRLLRGDPFPVWSVLVTIFGDCAHAGVDEVSGKFLTQLSGPLDIKPEALRVALHRLKKDNWIDTRRNGRNSFYKLTASALSESRAASPRFYELPAQYGQNLQLTFCDTAPASDHLEIRSGLWLGPQETVTSPALVIQCLKQTDQFLPIIMADDMRLQFRDFTNELPVAAPVDPLEALALRIIILHIWRRLVLSVPAWLEQDPVLGQTLAQTRQLVLKTLLSLPCPDQNLIERITSL